MNPIVLDPEPFPDPIIHRGDYRELMVAIEAHGREEIRRYKCLVSSHTGIPYYTVRTIRTAIFGKVKSGVVLEKIPDRENLYRFSLNDRVAIKILSKRLIAQSQESPEDPIKEIAALQVLSEPGSEFVLGIRECLQDDDKIYSIMPFCDGGEMFTLVDQHGAFPEHVAKKFFRQILKGVQYMSKHHRLCHRDMSLENLLVHHNDGTDNCIIIDMGMCLKTPPIDDPNARVFLRPQGRCGKINYTSPEIHLNNQPFNGEAVDMWACGVILFIMLTGIPPWENPSMLDPRFVIIARDGRLHEMLEYWRITHISSGAVDMMHRILKLNPMERLMCEEALQHPWLDE